MSDDDIKTLGADGLKELIIENALKTQSVEAAKRTQTRAYNELLKQIKHQSFLAMEVLEAKDSALARRIMLEVQGAMKQE